MKNTMWTKIVNVMVMVGLVFSTFTMMSYSTTGEATNENLSKETGYQITVGDVDISKVKTSLLNSITTMSEDERIPAMVKIDNDGVNLKDIKFNHDAVVTELKLSASETQEPVKAYMLKHDMQILNDFWITDYILVNATPSQVENITRLSSVKGVVENFEITIYDHGGEDVNYYTYTEDTDIGLHEQGTYQGDYTWGLSMINAPGVWKDLGFTGEGALYCSSDTGVDISHPDLQGKMWSDDESDPTYPGGWIEFDSNGDSVSGSTPHDTHSHGTHTAGTGVGGDASGTAIGVAPDAWLMHALTLPYGGGTFAQVVAGMEWSVEPYDSEGNPAGSPADVHSMSWGASGYHDEVIEPIQNMYYANVIPVASIGNSGEGSSGSPGNIYESFGIGASDDMDHIAWFSSGETVQKSWFSNPPDDWPEEWVKPDFAAPGVDVYSSIPGGGYSYYSGTSMAAPHVAGVIALIKSANPDVPPDTIYTALKDTAVWYDYYYPEPPDTRYGWGRIDAYNSTLLLALDSGIQGYVTDSDTEDSLSQTTVTVSNETVFRTSTSNTTGFYKAYLHSGTYNMTLSRFGYYDKNISNIVVNEDEWVWKNTTLDPTPHGYINGKAYYNATGYSIPGVTVKVLDIPVDISTMNDDDGMYLLQIPIGTYSVEANSPYFPPSRKDYIQVTEDESTTVNIPMYLWEPESVAVMGDYGNTITNLLTTNGYDVEERGWDIVSEVSEYSVIIVNAPGDPGQTTFLDFIYATDNAGTGVIFLDTWAHTYNGGGIWLLHEYLNDPPSRSTNFDLDINYLYYEVTESHPILEGYTPGSTFIFESSAYYHDHAWFDGYTGENGLVIANAGNDLYGIIGEGIAVDNRANNKHVLMSMHGASYYVNPTYWTDEAEQVFLNAVEWATPAITEDVVMVDWNLNVEPGVALWYEDFNITIKAKNVGAEAGWYTASLYINGEVEDSNVTKLSPNTWETVNFTVNREPVGDYAVTIGAHTTSFRVRPPRVTVEAQSIDPLPLANGSLITYNKSLGMQSIGELDGDGKITFDSPAGSRGNYTIIIYNPCFRIDYGKAQHYLLKHDVYVDDDRDIPFSPTIGNSSFIEIYLDQLSPRHSGEVRVAIEGIADEYFDFTAGTLILTPGVYETMNLMKYKTELSTWLYYSEEKEEYNLSEPKTITYRFGGTLLGMIHTETTDNEVTIHWNITDSYYNNLTKIVEEEVGVLGIKQAATCKPLITLYNSNGGILRSGYVEWSDKPAETTIPSGTTVAYSQVDVQTGSYQLDNKINLSCVIKNRDGCIILDGSVTNDEKVDVCGSVKRVGEPVLNAAATVNEQTVSIKLDGEFSTTINLSIGKNEIRVKAVDLAGTVRTEIMHITLKNTVYLSVYPVSNLTAADSITVSGVVETGANLTINYTELSYESDGSFSMTINLNEGVNIILVQAEDSIGNLAEKNLTVIRDTKPPEIEVIQPLNGTAVREEKIIVSVTTEPDATVFINGNPATVTSNGNFSSEITLFEGNNSINIAAIDNLGNTQSKTILVMLKKSVYLKVDAVESVTDKTSITLSGMVEEGANLTINGANVPVENNTFEYELSLTEGKNEISIRAEDGLGNIEEESLVVVMKKSVYLKVDAVESVTDKTSITLSGMVEEGANLTINGANVPVENNTFEYELSLTEGKNEISIRAEDGLGNIEEESLVVVMDTKVDKLTTLVWLLLAIMIATILVAGIGYLLGKRKRGGGKELMPAKKEKQQREITPKTTQPQPPAAQTVTSEAKPTQPLPPNEPQPVQQPINPQPVLEPVAKPVIVSCYKCGQKMQITSSVRPLEITCPKCGAKRMLK